MHLLAAFGAAFELGQHSLPGCDVIGLPMQPPKDAAELGHSTCVSVSQQPKGQRSLCVCASAGLDSLLHKDWRGRGFDRGIDQLIALIQSEKDVVSQTQVGSLC